MTLLRALAVALALTADPALARLAGVPLPPPSLAVPAAVEA
jgi:hypothetical protein